MNMPMKYLLALIIVLCCCSQQVMAQSTEKVLQLEQELESATGKEKIQILTKLGELYAFIDKEKAISLCREAIELSRDQQFEEGIAWGYIALGHVYVDISEEGLAEEVFLKADSIARGINDPAEISRSLQAMAQLRLRQGQARRSVDLSLEGIKMAEVSRDSSLLFGHHANIAFSYHTLTLYDSAILYYLEAAKYCDVEPMLDCAKLYNNMAITYHDRQEMDKAILYNNKSLEIRIAANDSAGIADSYINIAGAHWVMGQPDSAVLFVNKAYNTYQKNGSLRGQSMCLNNLGILYNVEGEYNKAISSYRRAINLYKQTIDNENLAIAYHNISEPFVAIKNYGMALTYNDSSITWAKQIGSKMLLREGYKLHSQIYRLQGNTELAWSANDTYHAYKDSITNKESLDKIAELEARYDNEKKEKEIELQRHELRERDLAIQRNRLVVAALVLLLAGLIALGLMQRNRQRLRTQALIAEEKQKAREQQIDAIIRTVEKERKRFSEDLHDGFGQYLSILRMNLEGLRVGAESSDQSGSDLFSDAEKILKEMGSELQNICFNLMPKTLIQHGITASLEELALKVNKSGQMRMSVDFFGFEDNERLQDLQEISLYRICQEWLNNVLKYSSANEITYQLIRDNDDLNLTIEDNGQGFDTNLLTEGSGNGWKNMVSRANLIGAEIYVDSTSGIEGTTFVLTTEEYEKVEDLPEQHKPSLV